MTHYESYQESVKKDILPGFVEFAKTLPTADPARYPTIFSYLTAATAALKTGKDYNVWLKGHQTALLGALERFVESQPLRGLDLIQGKGWRWFRFSKERVLLHGDKPMVWVPRHPTEIQDVCFDAIELEQVFDSKSQELAQGVYDKKKDLPGWRFFPGTGWIDRADVNTNNIQDWTSRLFP